MKKICRTTDVSVGMMKGFTINQKQILIANVDNKYYAIDAICTHRRGYLPKGKLEDNVVICPVHGVRYDVITGKVVKDVSRLVKVLTRRGARDLTSYKLEIKDEEIFIETWPEA